MSEEMRKYTYIQSIGNNKHLVQDDYLMAYYPEKVALRIAEESEIGVKLNDLVLKIISSYPEYLRKK